MMFGIVYDESQLALFITTTMMIKRNPKRTFSATFAEQTTSKQTLSTVGGINFIAIARERVVFSVLLFKILSLFSQQQSQLEFLMLFLS
jgi:hypothetical protein